MHIPYQYPVVYLDGEDPEDALVQQEQGILIPVRLDREPYEAIVEARGYSFHILFGSQMNGNFLCIPNWNTGCELASLSDRSWNLDSLLKTDHLDYEESTAIIEALSILSRLIQQ